MKKSLYLLPWTHSNNPNGWIEPTTFCQLKCPNCYRGCDRADHKPEHRDLDDVKAEVEKFIIDRNVQTISIAGGEPLLYPFLDELVDYIKSKKLKVMIFTNGVLLNEKRLEELKNLGVDQIVLHIDSYQNRPGIKREEDANKLKEAYCNLFRKVKGVSLGFISYISKDNIDDIKKTLDFYKQNNDVVSLIDFTLLTDSFFTEDNKNHDRLNANVVYKKIKDLYNLEYCAYIEKSLTADITWLCGTAIFSGKNYLGSVDKDAVKFLHEEYYKKNKRHIFIGNSLSLSPKTILKFISNKSLRKIAWNYLKLKHKKKITFQVVLIISPPEVIGKKFNICSCCPDSMYYQGKLVPSCIYSQIKNGQRDGYQYYCDDYCAKK